jgi:hypothetical protein
MAFTYPSAPLQRRHGPRGYTNYQQFKPWLRDEFTFRCVFCLNRETWEPNSSAYFGVDHFSSQSQSPELVCDYDNLIYLCNRCNSWKRNQSGILDPCLDAFSEHLAVKDDGTIEGLTPEGRELIRKLELDNSELIEFRRRTLRIIRVLAASSDPEAAEALRDWMGFPPDIPDLRKLRPPGGNSRPAGITRCHFVLRERGELPETY